MRPLALDPSVWLPALLFPSGMRRKLLVVAAWSNLQHYKRFGSIEDLELVRRELGSGGLPGGRDVRELVECVSDICEIVGDELPPLTPDDIPLISSPPLLREIQRKVRSPRLLEKLPDLSAVDAASLVNAHVTSSSAIIIPDFDSQTIPHYTEGRDRDDDYLVHTALVGGAFAIISDDRHHIALSDDEPTIYSGDGGVVPAYQFMPFVETELNTFHFDLGEVDGKLLNLIQEQLTLHGLTVD